MTITANPPLPCEWINGQSPGILDIITDDIGLMLRIQIYDIYNFGPLVDKIQVLADPVIGYALWLVQIIHWYFFPFCTFSKVYCEDLKKKKNNLHT